MFKDKTEGLINFSDLKNNGVKVIYLLMFLFLVILALTCLLPVVWAFLSAFKSPAEMYAIPPTFLPSKFDWSSVGRVATQINIFGYLLSTIQIIIGCLIVDVVFNGFAGYVLSKIRPAGSAFLETLIFWSMMLPSVSMAPLYLTFVDMPIIHVNITKTFLPMWIMAGCNAFNIMLTRNFFNGIPKEYLEAARMDGCSDVGIFFRIMLPLSKPLLAVIAIYSVIASWNTFLWPYLILGGTNLEPLSVLLFQLSASGLGLKENDVLLVTMLVSIPPMFIFSFLSKHISGGLNMSGIKG